MVRSLYSGVTGMKAHQTRLDVIGNNLANVNTIGYKGSSVTFRDVYYQTLRGAAAGDGTKGGLTPSQVGYGAEVGSININMTQSASTTTGNPWDISIGGEGYFQVQDADGNIFYTRAGKLGYDNNGYLIDSMGNFVLGTSAKNGSVVGQKPGKNRIQMTVPSVNPTKASWTNTINNVQYTLTAGKETEDGNVTVNFLSKQLDAGVAATAVVSSSGITVTLGSDYTFGSMDDVNRAINAAIKAANGGEEHPAGEFTLSADTDEAALFGTGLTGAELVNSSSSPTPGDLVLTDAADANILDTTFGFKFADPPVGEGFMTNGEITDFTIEDKYEDPGHPRHDYEITMTVAGQVYTATINESQMTQGRKLALKREGGEADDTITLICPSNATLIGKAGENVNTAGQPNPYTINPLGADALEGYSLTPTIPSKNIGLNSNAFTLKEGTEGGPQTLKDISGFNIGADGVIHATHRGRPLELGRIDLAVFQNPSGLEQVGGTYFAANGASGDPSIVTPGVSGTGALAGSTLELSNVDLSQEFADMITTQRGFQACSRMITVSDTLLEELINLKR